MIVISPAYVQFWNFRPIIWYKDGPPMVPLFTLPFYLPSSDYYTSELTSLVSRRGNRFNRHMR